MSTKMVALMVVGVLTLMSEIVSAEVPDFCAVAPVPGFDGSRYQKWGFYPEEKKCLQFTWGGHRGKGNHFDTELECLKTCRPSLLPKVVENYDLVAGQCLCQCPKCNNQPITKAPTTIPVTTAKIPVTRGPITRGPITTESTTTKNWFFNLFGA